MFQSEVMRSALFSFSFKWWIKTKDIFAGNSMWFETYSRHFRVYLTKSQIGFRRPTMQSYGSLKDPIMALYLFEVLEQN